MPCSQCPESWKPEPLSAPIRVGRGADVRGGISHQAQPRLMLAPLAGPSGQWRGLAREGSHERSWERERAGGVGREWLDLTLPGTTMHVRTCKG
jgi:hypothetical protein